MDGSRLITSMAIRAITSAARSSEIWVETHAGVQPAGEDHRSGPHALATIMGLWDYTRRSYLGK